MPAWNILISETRGPTGLIFVLPDGSSLCRAVLLTRNGDRSSPQGTGICCNNHSSSSHISQHLCWEALLPYPLPPYTTCSGLGRLTDFCIWHPPNCLALWPPIELVLGEYRPVIRAREERALGGIYDPHSCPTGCLVIFPSPHQA